MKVGLLTGGGDCAGLNSLIRAAVKRIEEYGWEAVGIRYGWRGLLDNDMVDLSYESVSEKIGVGGTILKTSRTNPIKLKDGAETVVRNFNRAGLYALLAIGGDDTLGVASALYRMGLKVVGAPKTIDNDLSATDITFGFDSAVNEAMHALDNLKTTGESHDRVMVAEVMGREAGWIAAHAGIAAGAHIVLVPEEPFSVSDVISSVKARHNRNLPSTLIVVAEGARLKDTGKSFSKEGRIDAFEHPELGGIGQFLANEITRESGYETRAVTLGHTIRGGTPTAFDRYLATRFGLAAVDLIKEGKFGMMVAIHGTEIKSVKLEDAVSSKKFIDGTMLGVLKALSY